MATTTVPAGKRTAKPPRANAEDRTVRWWAIGFAVAVPVIFIFYQYLLPNLTMESTVETWMPMNVVNTMMIWVIMALGLNVVVGYAGLLDLGFVAFWAIGTYVGAWCMSIFFGQYGVNIHFGSAASVASEPGIHINFWIVVVFGGAVCALFGVLIGAPTLRLRSDYLALVTLGFGEIIPQFFTNGDHLGCKQQGCGFNLTNGTQGIGPVDPIPMGPLGNISGVPRVLGPFDQTWRFLLFSIIAALCVFISLRIRRGRLGRAWLAIREDELAAHMMGVSVVKAKLSSYAVGAIFGGMGGVAYAVLVGGAFPNFTFANSITVLLMVVLGGMGNVWGVMVGALVLAWINENGMAQFGKVVNDNLGTHIDFTSYNFLIFGLILVLMMMFRREGLIPATRTRAIMHEPSRTESESLHADIAEAEQENEALIAETEEHTGPGAPPGMLNGGTGSQEDER